MSDFYYDDNELDKEKIEEPKHHKKLRNFSKPFLIIGAILLVVGFAFFIINMFRFSFETSWMSFVGIFVIAGGAFCIMIGIISAFMGNSGKLSSMATKSVRYIQETNKDDLTAIMNNNADINSGAIKKTVRAFKEGWTGEESNNSTSSQTTSSQTKYCVHCGKKISKNAKFCSECGEKQ